MIATLEQYLDGLAKIRPHVPVFRAAGWTMSDLTCCGLKPYDHHGLAFALRGREIGRIFPWCCELLCSVAGDGKRSRLFHWRRAPLATLLATIGDVVPAVLKEEWRVAKL